MSRDVALERNADGLRAALGVITRLETTSSEPALLNMAAGLLRPSAGEVLYRGQPVRDVAILGFAKPPSSGGPSLSLSLANFERPHRLRGMRNIGSFSTIS